MANVQKIKPSRMTGRKEDTVAPRGQHFEAGKDESTKYCRDARRDAVDDSLGLLKLQMFSELSPKVGD